jgi:repressor LexA
MEKGKFCEKLKLDVDSILAYGILQNKVGCKAFLTYGLFFLRSFLENETMTRFPSPSDSADHGQKLTSRQLEILAYIQQEISESGRPPSYREIAKHFRYDAVGTVQDHISALIKKGFLERDEKIARGIRLAHRPRSPFRAVEIPILGIVPAGKPIEALENSIGMLSVSVREKGEYYALKVKGDSMKDAGILDGDFAIVRKQNQAESGEIVIALIGDEATVKILEKKRGRVRLLPANPAFSPIELGGTNTEIKTLIQGRVVSVQRYYSSLGKNNSP